MTSADLLLLCCAGGEPAGRVVSPAGSSCNARAGFPPSAATAAAASFFTSDHPHLRAPTCVKSSYLVWPRDALRNSRESAVAGAATAAGPAGQPPAVRPSWGPLRRRRSPITGEGARRRPEVRRHLTSSGRLQVTDGGGPPLLPGVRLFWLGPGIITKN